MVGRLDLFFNKASDPLRLKWGEIVSLPAKMFLGNAEYRWAYTNYGSSYISNAINAVHISSSAIHPTRKFAFPSLRT